MKIKGYTLHGDYYLANKFLAHTNWKEACEMKEEVTLPNGKTVIAHILSKEELESIPREKRRGICGFWYYWYWTSTPTCDGAWFVNCFGDFGRLSSINYGNNDGGVRLGFHKNEIKQFLDIE